MKLSEAVRLSKLKWEFMVEITSKPDYENDFLECLYLLNEKYPELSILEGDCGLCEYQLQLYEDWTNICDTCPLAILGGASCNYPDSPHYKFRMNPTKENAQILLDLINQIQFTNE